mmetsp:Transcript_75742/g.169589  ORF Transcript_75742/g.169589 Transcript_75742/m.169589 type:complete len:224 (-) Transcript_75742:297-968(-)
MPVCHASLSSCREVPKNTVAATVEQELLMLRVLIAAFALLEAGLTAKQPVPKHPHSPKRRTRAADPRRAQPRHTRTRAGCPSTNTVLKTGPLPKTLLPPAPGRAPPRTWLGSPWSDCACRSPVLLLGSGWAECALPLCVVCEAGCRSDPPLCRAPPNRHRKSTPAAYARCLGLQPYVIEERAGVCRGQPSTIATGRSFCPSACPGTVRGMRCHAAHWSDGRAV